MEKLSLTSDIGRQCPNREEIACPLILAVPNVLERQLGGSHFRMAVCHRNWFLWPQSAARQIGREHWSGYICNLLKV
jgi:hypothetical protein